MTVRIYLPSADDGAEAADAPRGETSHLQQGSETILLVEDDQRLRRVLSRRLKSLGYQVFEAKNGAPATAQLAHLPEQA